LLSRNLVKGRVVNRMEDLEKVVLLLVGLIYTRLLRSVTFALLYVVSHRSNYINFFFFVELVVFPLILFIIYWFTLPRILFILMENQLIEY
jgi:hypothetical protein